MGVRRYGIYVRVFTSISNQWAQRTSEISNVNTKNCFAVSSTLSCTSTWWLDFFSACTNYYMLRAWYRFYPLARRLARSWYGIKNSWIKTISGAKHEIIYMCCIRKCRTYISPALNLQRWKPFIPCDERPTNSHSATKLRPDLVNYPPLAGAGGRWATSRKTAAKESSHPGRDSF